MCCVSYVICVVVLAYRTECWWKVDLSSFKRGICHEEGWEENEVIIVIEGGMVICIVASGI